MLSYMITDPKYKFGEIIDAIKRHHPNFVCYRNKEYFDLDEIKEFVKEARNYSITIYNIHFEEKEAIDLFDGVHIPSSKLDKIEKYEDKIKIASTHSIKEALAAKKADYITFSPVFDTKNKKGVGIEKLNEICKIHPSVIALGGIKSQKEVEKIELSDAIGFAGIRYFMN